jgi:hypothetical protein
MRDSPRKHKTVRFLIVTLSCATDSSTNYLNQYILEPILYTNSPQTKISALKNSAAHTNDIMSIMK